MFDSVDDGLDGVVATLFECLEDAHQHGLAVGPAVAAPQPLTPQQVLEKQRANQFGTPPTNLKDVLNSILHKTCKGTPV